MPGFIPGRELSSPQFVPNFVTGADCGLTLIIRIPQESWWEVVKWSKLLSLLQSLHAVTFHHDNMSGMMKLRSWAWSECLVWQRTMYHVSCDIRHRGVRRGHSIVNKPGPGVRVGVTSEDTVIPSANWASSEQALSQVSSLCSHWSSSGCGDQSDRSVASSSGRDCDNSKMTPGHRVWTMD